VHSDEQIRWFMEAWRRQNDAHERADVRAVTAWRFSFVYWDSLVTRANGNYEAALLML